MKHLFLLCIVLFSQSPLFAQSNKIIYSGNFSNGLYAYGMNDVAIQEKVQKVLEETLNAAADEWDVNVSESWSILKSNFPNQQITILADSAHKHNMMCKLSFEFYPKSGTKVMDAFLKREQQSMDNETKLNQDFTEKKITREQSAEQMNKLDLAIWGAPSAVLVFTNDFPLNDSAWIKITEPNVSDCSEINVTGADYATVCTETSLTSSHRVTTIYLGNYSKGKSGNLLLQHPESSQWEKQNTIKIKVYTPDDVALMLINKFNLKKLKELLK